MKFRIKCFVNGQFQIPQVQNKNFLERILCYIKDSI